MTDAFFPTRRLLWALRCGLTALAISISSIASAENSSDVAVVGDVTIYYAVLPAEMLRTYPPSSGEARMHGGVPGGRHIHHLQVALFDTRTGARITDASVSAKITEVGFSGVQRVLDPFQIGDAQTYGGYFEFQKRDFYEIGIRAILPGDGGVITKTFKYRHQ